ncbi:fibronectin type III domain-containing protein [Sphaerotilus mobilis]|uniref:fibronectin type III domain-containing protein n=1 Tax=Sphaerotilus mobilis TaxID=47994 RepID=UPI00102CF0D1|nr:fibronectin type III domain-containing protein [Sphaerotilus mobilis]
MRQRFRGHVSVTVAEARTVQPFFARSAAPQIHADVVVLSDATLDELVSDTQQVLTFKAGARQLDDLREGAVIISGRGAGFARRILKKIVLPQGNFLLDTLPVSLSDIIEDGTLIGGYATAGSGTEGIARVLSLGQGVTLANRARPLGASSEFNVDVPLNAEETSKITGKINVEWNPEFAVDFRLGSGLKEAELLVNPTVRPDLSFVKGPEDIEKEVLFDLGVFELTPFTIQVGFVPVVVVPTVKGYAKVSAKGGVQVNFASGYSLQGSYGAHYRKGSGWDGVFSTQLDGNFTPVGAVKIEGELGVGVYMAMAVYNVIGPFIQVGPYLRATGELNTASETGLCKKFRADLGIAAKVGGSFKVLSWYESKLELSLIDKVVKNLVDTQSSSCNDTTPPLSPEGLNAVATGSRTIELSWTPSTDEGGLRGHQVERDGVVVALAREGKHVDASLQAGHEHCYRIIAVDLSGNQSLPSTRACARTSATDRTAPTVPAQVTATATSTTAIHLSWQANSDDVGVIGYVVSANGKRLRSLADTSMDIGKLTPETNHCLVIEAFDAMGNVSPPSEPVCVSTLPPDQAAWTMQLGCVGRDHNISRNIDLDVDGASLVNVTGEAIDYSGSALAYHLHGSYEPSTHVLDAQIDWTFSNSTAVRMDRFTAQLSTDDTGPVTMTQVLKTGCDANIRFVQNTR